MPSSPYHLTMPFTEYEDSEPESEGVDLSGCNLIVSWSSLVLLLSKCQLEDCADRVLADNMKVSRNGEFDLKELWGYLLLNLFLLFRGFCESCNDL